MLLNCGAGEDSWESLGQQGRSNQLILKEINPEYSARGTDAEAETPILWSPNVKNWLIRKDPDAGKDWRKEKRMTEDEIVGWHHRFDGHEFVQAPGVEDGHRSLACCSPWIRKESNTTEQLTWAIEDTGGEVSIPEAGRSTGEGNSKPLQYSCLENPMDRGTWQATVHRVAESQTQLKWLSTM